jgi:hypothetical protein
MKSGYELNTYSRASPDSIEQDDRKNNELEFGGEEPHQIDDDDLSVVSDIYYGEDEEEPAELFVDKDHV